MAKRKKGSGKKKAAIAVGVLCVAGAAGFFAMKKIAPQMSKDMEIPASMVSEATVSTATIANTITGSGSLAASDAEDIVIPTGITIDKVLVESGDKVTEGQALATVNLTSVATAISEIQTSISALDEKLEDIDEDSEDQTLTAALSGRVKGIMISEGDDVADVIAVSGSLLTLSVDGKMAVSFVSESEVAAGDDVVVTLSDGTKKDGSVESVTAGKTTVTLTDNGPKMGDEVTITASDGSVLGEGSLTVHQPITVTAVSGTVDDVCVKENEKVDQGDDLIELTDALDTASKNELLAERQDLADALNSMLTLQSTGQIVSTYSGTIASVNVADNTEVTRNSSSDNSSSGSSAGNSIMSSGSAQAVSAQASSSSAAHQVMSASYGKASGSSFTVSASGNSGFTVRTAAYGSGAVKTMSAVSSVKPVTESADPEETEEIPANKSAEDAGTAVDKNKSADPQKEETTKAAEEETTKTAETTKAAEEEAAKAAEKDTTRAAENETKADKEESKTADVAEAAAETEKEIVYGGDMLILPLTAPAAGCAPMTTELFAAVAKAAGYDYKVSKVSWNTDEAFAAGGSYTAYVTLKFDDDGIYQYLDKKGEMMIRADGCESYSYTYTGNKVTIAVKYVLPEEESSSQPADETKADETKADETKPGDGQTQEETQPEKETSPEGGDDSGTTPGGGSGSGSGGGSGSGSGSSNSSGSSSSSASTSEDIYSIYETAGFTISEDEYMTVSISVSEQDILSVKEGQKVEVELDSQEGKTFEGEVTAVASSGSNSGGSTKYTVTVSLPKDETMLSGMSATAVITTSSAEDVLTIPSSALQERGGVSFVYTEKDDEGNLSGETEVTTGLSDGSNVEIQEGLTEGETVYYNTLTGSAISSDDDEQTDSGFGGGMTGGSGGGPGGNGGGPGGSGGGAPSGGHGASFGGGQ